MGKGGVAIQEALVELFADVVGKAGDFATAGGRPRFAGQVDGFVSAAAILTGERLKVMVSDCRYFLSGELLNIIGVTR